MKQDGVKRDGVKHEDAKRDGVKHDGAKREDAKRDGTTTQSMMAQNVTVQSRSAVGFLMPPPNRVRRMFELLFRESLRALSGISPGSVRAGVRS
ncbi:hypothetical protein [Streptomyces sp. NPDC048669]|uniref:hypothetical protein n=1 Tax=Streptomyces sp. NPDC048669 TaxID=3155267 RepID=UPI0034134A3B